MTRTDDPVRLAALGSGAPNDLARAIHGLRNEVGSATTVQALEQRLMAELGPAALASASSAPATCSIWLSIVGLSLLGSVFMPPPAQPKRAGASAAVVSAATVAAPATPPTTLAPQVTVEPLPPSLLPAPKPQPRRARRTTPATAHTTRASLPQPEVELALLRRAQAVLHNHPAAAFELAEQHASDYPHGIFAQEREILAIEALLKQHKRSLALARAQQFIDRYETSPYAMRVQALLEQTPRGPAAPMLAEANAGAEAAARSGSR
jgi:hypothetical protein